MTLFQARARQSQFTPIPIVNEWVDADHTWVTSTGGYPFCDPAEFGQIPFDGKNGLCDYCDGFWRPFPQDKYKDAKLVLEVEGSADPAMFIGSMTPDWVRQHMKDYWLFMLAFEAAVKVLPFQAGIFYAVNGVCHQATNRMLVAAQPIRKIDPSPLDPVLPTERIVNCGVSKGMLSYIAFGAYGDMIPAHISSGWEDCAFNPAALTAQALVPLADCFRVMWERMLDDLRAKGWSPAPLPCRAAATVPSPDGNEVDSLIDGQAQRFDAHMTDVEFMLDQHFADQMTQTQRQGVLDFARAYLPSSQEYNHALLTELKKAKGDVVSISPKLLPPPNAAKVSAGISQAMESELGSKTVAVLKTSLN